MEDVSHDEVFPGTREKLYRWWREDILCDVTLVCEDSVEVPAHSLILALHSSFFYQELEGLKRTEQPHVLNIDVLSTVLRLLLECIYSGKLSFSEENIKEVTECAEKYEFDSIIRLFKNSKFNLTNVKEDKKQISKTSKLKVTKLKPCKEISERNIQRSSSSRKRTKTNLSQEMSNFDSEHQCVRRSTRVRKKSSKTGYIIDFSEDEHYDDEDYCYFEAIESDSDGKSKKSRLFPKSDKSDIQKHCDKKQKRKSVTKQESKLKSDNSFKTVQNLREKYSSKRSRNLPESRDKLLYVERKVNFSQLKTRQLCLGYYTTNFMRIALSRLEGEITHKEKLCHCCVCQRKFHSYSSWSLHYRTQHLSHLLQRISRLKLRKVTHKVSKTRRKVSASTPVTMTSGCARKMPGPRCSQTPGNMVGCVECGVKLASRASLKKHLMAYHNMDRSQVEQHKSLLVQCEVIDCAFTNIDIHKVERHVRDSHPELKHPCPQCPVVFVRHDLLNQHVLRIHQNLTRYACSVCGSPFKRSGDQKIHEQLKHGVQHHLVIHRCKEAGCEYTTTTVRYLDAHRRTCHRDNRIQCSYCNLKLKSKVALQMHVNSLHLKKRPFLCEICGSGFCDQWTLQRHIAFRHSSARAFSCQHCSYACNNRIQFMNHSYQQHGQRVESDRRQELRCPHCEYRALSTSRMNSHVRHIHADPHTHTCEICGKGFKNPHYLRDHQVIHSESTLQCPHCDYSPLTSSKLKKHLRTQHLFKDIKPYSCPYCPFACSQSGNCRKHVTHKHPGCEVRYNTDNDLMDYMRRVEAQLQAGKISNK